MKIQYHLLLIAALVSLITACQPDKTQLTMVMSGKTMGTVWRVTVVGIEPARKQQLQQKIEQQLDQDDWQLSTWKPRSRLSIFNRYQGNQPQPISADMADIITMALRIGKQTHGAMDITVGPLVDLWGFGPRKAPAYTPSKQKIEATMAITGLQHLQVIQTLDGAMLRKNLPALSLDLSTMGEGYATDHLARLMEQEGVRNYLVSVGGALISRGLNAKNKAWRVAIQKPVDTSNEVQAIVDLQGHGISTSGDYRNYYELDGKRISHVIDPKTGHPITHHLVSATVIATTTLEADGWDTGLLVLGTEKAKELAIRNNLAVYLIIKEQGKFKTWYSPMFKTFLLQQSSDK